MDDDLPLKPSYIIGQDISALSVDELGNVIAMLNDEIKRIEHERGTKASTISAAEALFRRP